MTNFHTLYDIPYQHAPRSVKDYPTEELRLTRLDQLDREGVAKGYRRPPHDTSMLETFARPTLAGLK